MSAKNLFGDRVKFLLLMESLETLHKYFSLLVQQYLKEHFPSGKAEVYADKFTKVLDQLINDPKNQKFFVNETASLHAINPLFVIAFSKAVAAEFYTREQLESMIMDIYAIMVKSLLDRQKAEVEKADNPWQFFIENTKKNNHKLYENEFFQVEYIVEDRLRFGFNINRCFYHDIFQANQAGSLAPIMCKYDNLLADNLKKWVRFQRNKTIAEGDPCCEFRYFRNV